MNTKKLTTISLFVFWAIVTALLVAGLLFYQNKKVNQNQVKSVTEDIGKMNGVTLDMTEISKHNKESDCWMLINGKVYNITSYFGSHPGGNATMSATCGTDATSAYMTKDPNATTNGSRSAHSSNAVSLLANYYIGELNQTIGQNKITETNSVTTPPAQGDDEYEYEDD